MGESSIAKNPSAGRDFELLETLEAGIELKGSEVKSLRNHRANLKDSFARISVTKSGGLSKRGGERGGHPAGDVKEAWLYGLDISPYPQAGRFAPEPKRVRKLLLHRQQIERLEGRLTQKGLTLVATKLYFRGPRVKVELALAKGKKFFDKREAIKKREAAREIERAVKYRRGS